MCLVRLAHETIAGDVTGIQALRYWLERNGLQCLTRSSIVMAVFRIGPNKSFCNVSELATIAVMLSIYLLLSEDSQSEQDFRTLRLE